MTGSTSRLSDELLRRSLSELAANPDGSALLTDVLRRVDGTAQVGRRPWDAPGWGRAGLLVATVLLVTAALGAAAGFSALQPQPQPIPSPPAVLSDAITVSDFAVPFTYRLPAGETAKLRRIGAAKPTVLLSRQRGSSDRLYVFQVDGHVHACPEATGDPENPSLEIDTNPALFLEALRNDAGVGIGPVSSSMLGTLPALSADIDPDGSVCGRYAFHVDGLGIGAPALEPAVENPSRLLVGRSGTTSIGVLISSATQEGLAQWLPIAQAYVDSFVFETGPQPSAVPEPTPSGAASPLPTVPGLGSSLVLQHFNGVEGAGSVIAHTEFAPGAATGTGLGGLPDNAITVRWAPSGSRVTYFTAEMRRGGLSGRLQPVAVDFFLANSDGSGTSRVQLPRPVDRYTSAGYWAGAVWSPTGASFAIGWSTSQCNDGPDCLPDGGYDIIDQAGSLVTTIEFPDLGSDPIWSPDGRAIGWFTGSCPNGLCVTDAFNWRFVDGDPTVTTVPGNFGQVVWAPDGRLHVVTLAADGSRYSVQTMTPDGGDARQVGSTAHGDALPIWSPDGRWLAQVDRRGSLWLRDVNADTEVSFSVPPDTSVAAWSPDSRSIALYTESATNPSGYSFLLVGVDGGDVFAAGDGEDFGWLIK